MERNTILQGDALTVLRTLPDSSVHCCITSPPYYALRSYLPDDAQEKGQELGQEETPQEYLAKLVVVFQEVYRVLRSDGTCWMNIGDTRSNEKKWGGKTGGKHRLSLHDQPRPRRYTGMREKNILGIPWRLAFLLQDDGWILRQGLVWQKPTAMPEPVTDRCVDAHEYLFLLVKRPTYFFDAEAIREPLKPKTLTTFGTQHHAQQNDAWGLVKSDNWGSSLGERQPTRNIDGELSGANKRSVWTVASQPNTEGTHCATFPEKLIEPCVLAGSAPRVCETCATPWKRVYQRTGQVNKRETAHVPHNTPTKQDSTGWHPVRVATNEWASACGCANTQGIGKAVILDPFMGSGTTALVALRHARDFVGIELNPLSIEEALRRIETVQPRLWTGLVAS